MSPRFEQIKRAILSQIERRELSAGDKVPSENQIATQFNVSRMTARRALTDLVTANVLMRSQGAGTFVADQRPLGTMLSIQSIEQEIRQRGHSYASNLLSFKEVKASANLAVKCGVATNDNLYYLEVVHFENDVAVQLETRWVNPNAAPDFMRQDFTQITAHEYLSEVAPLSEADHQIEASLPNEHIATNLAITCSEPCLILSRQTYSKVERQLTIVSFARLYHPGARYRLGGHLDF